MALIKEYRSDMQKKELLLTYTEYGEGPDYYEKMLKYNDIQGVMKYRKDLNDGISLYVYDAGGKRPIALEYENRKPGYNELKNLLYDIIESIEQSKDYLIREEDFVINDECVFVDDQGVAHIVCLPGYNKPLKSQLSTLFEFFMDKIDYKDKAAVSAYYADKKIQEDAAKAAAEKEAEEKAKAERLANPTAEDLLKDIKALLQKQAK